MGFTFNGGIHPYDGKDLSKDKPIITYVPKGEMVYPLSQHIGAPAKAVVAKGDRVCVGTLLAEAGGFVSAPIFSTVSGTVKSIEPRRTVTGDMQMSIVVDNDGQFEEIEWEDGNDVDSMSRESIIEAIQKAGIVGMGGAGFPTHVKMSPKEPEKIEYIIANCAECEPYLTSDYRIMIEETDMLIGGMKTALKLFPNARGIFAIEDNKPDCIKRIKEMTANEDRMEVRALTTKYPQGSERQLIYAVTKRAINSSNLPADAGCIVDNVDTLVSVYNAVKYNRPLLYRIVTVTGDAVKNPCNFKTPLGVCIDELIEAAGGFAETPEKIIAGGPMMGFAMFDTAVPIVKTSSAILAIKKDEVAQCKESACINCGMCVEACPSRLIPSRLAKYANNNNEEGFLALHGMECMECGCCSYVCPAKRHLTQSIKTMRKIQLGKRKAGGK